MRPKWINNPTVHAGVASGVAGIAFFFIIRHYQLDYVLKHHFFHLLLIAAAIVYALIRKNRLNGGLPYLYGFMEGIKTACVSAIITNFFLLIYLFSINPVYMRYVVAKEPLGEYMGPLIIALVLFTEQVSGGMIITLIVMQLFKEKTVQ